MIHSVGPCRQMSPFLMLSLTCKHTLHTAPFLIRLDSRLHGLRSNPNPPESIPMVTGPGTPSTQANITRTSFRASLSSQMLKKHRSQRLCPCSLVSAHTRDVALRTHLSTQNKYSFVSLPLAGSWTATIFQDPHDHDPSISNSILSTTYNDLLVR